MCTDRRNFLRRSAGLAGATLFAADVFGNGNPEAIVPGYDLMEQNKIDAIYIEPGTSMFYFTGMRWGTSERMFALVIPARGDIAWVCPKFEEERARELIK